MRAIRIMALACSSLLATPVVAQAPAADAFIACAHDAAAQTVSLSGHDLTIEQLVLIARHGAAIALTPAARQRSADAYGLLLEAAAEGLSVYWFNRGSGSQRETTIFSGDPTSAANMPGIKARQLANFARGETGSYGPEVDHEDAIRAMMAIRANAMSYEAASPALTQMLIDMVNHDVIPVVHAQGSLGEGDLALMGDIGRAMVGKGDVHYRGVRMPAAQALQAAGLQPLEPFGADDAALVSTNAWFTANAALLVADSRNLLEWTDLATAMALLGMNSSVTPLSAPVQANRPYPWLNWDAARVLDMVRGSYLLEADPKRIIQDPESLRASTQRVGSAWAAWAAMRDSVMIAMNSSDHNPAVRPGVQPGDSWELATPQLMQFHVQGGALSHGQGGYILSDANWDPYPLSNQVEGFTIALANMGVVLAQRIERFTNPFFTVVRPGDVMTPAQAAALPYAGGYLPSDLWIELSGLINPVSPQGQPIVNTVEDLQAETRLKVARARQAVDLTTHLLAQDIVTSTNWIEVRKVQNPARNFGAAPTAALAAVRVAVPLKPGTGPGAAGMAVYGLITTTPVTRFYPGGPVAPAAAPVPVAQR
ncbi:aromatic amino acid ammonia-lyase [Novosphingobium sp.]|uniref:aromatic amino acid ammonia-lyase n=1 Tax=Novosphingobium sp. TaxID=1874826 RepID=UPI0033412D87